MASTASRSWAPRAMSGWLVTTMSRRPACLSFWQARTTSGPTAAQDPVRGPPGRTAHTPHRPVGELPHGDPATGGHVAYGAPGRGSRRRQQHRLDHVAHVAVPLALRAIALDLKLTWFRAQL